MNKQDYSETAIGPVSDLTGLLGAGLPTCPFCGSPPVLEEKQGVYRQHYKMKCGTANCYGNPQSYRTWATPTEAIIEWSTRAPNAELRRAADEL